VVGVVVGGVVVVGVVVGGVVVVGVVVGGVVVVGVVVVEVVVGCLVVVDPVVAPTVGGTVVGDGTVEVGTPTAFARVVDVVADPTAARAVVDTLVAVTVGGALITSPLTDTDAGGIDTVEARPVVVAPTAARVAIAATASMSLPSPRATDAIAVPTRRSTATGATLAHKGHDR
jgi:hypothetical protein